MKDFFKRLLVSLTLLAIMYAAGAFLTMDLNWVDLCNLECLRQKEVYDSYSKSIDNFGSRLVFLGMTLISLIIGFGSE